MTAPGAASPPTRELSRAISEAVNGRELLAAVFLTYSFDPAFFEQEILPVLLDCEGSAPAVRLLQSEEALRRAPVAVYYDPRALDAGTQSARLDVRRVPVLPPRGAFHPKVVLALVRARDPDRGGHLAVSLVVAAMSANLTRSGWWENVECCHVEEVGEGQRCGFADDLKELAKRLRKLSPPDEPHEALDRVRSFLRGVVQREQSTSKGVLHARLHPGGEPLADWLEGAAGRSLRGLRLEVISPFFDAAGAAPLQALVDRFEPPEIRVLLPRNAAAEATCHPSVHAAVAALPNARWGRLPPELMRSGAAASAPPRRVHAKVYRFFDPAERREILLIGSPNLTTAAHHGGRNAEAAFLVEVQPARAPGWWLEVDPDRVPSFAPEAEETGEATNVHVPLAIRHDWLSGSTRVLWGGDAASPMLVVTSPRGTEVAELDALPPGAWIELAPETSARFAESLRDSSFLVVTLPSGEVGTILACEEGMEAKPSLLLLLSAADILRSWSLLTPEQRAAFLEERLADVPAAAAALGFDPLHALGRPDESMFSTFAGIFHGFGCLERATLDALKAKRDREAVSRLLGRRHDSLHGLLDRLDDAEGDGDAVADYVTFLCARQVLARVRADHPAFATTHEARFAELEARLDLAPLRARLDLPADVLERGFVSWFEEWFLAQGRAGRSR